jgi:hypothetical protein
MNVHDDGTVLRRFESNDPPEQIEADVVDILG